MQQWIWRSEVRRQDIRSAIGASPRQASATAKGGVWGEISAKGASKVGCRAFGIRNAPRVRAGGPLGLTPRGHQCVESFSTMPRPDELRGAGTGISPQPVDYAERGDAHLF